MKSKVDVLMEQVNELQKENLTLKDLNNRINKAKNGHGDSCSQCEVLMLANEKLIGRMKKYEGIIKFSNMQQQRSLSKVNGRKGKNNNESEELIRKT